MADDPKSDSFLDDDNTNVETDELSHYSSQGAFFIWMFTLMFFILAITFLVLGFILYRDSTAVLEEDEVVVEDVVKDTTGDVTSIVTIDNDTEVAEVLPAESTFSLEAVMTDLNNRVIPKIEAYYNARTIEEVATASNALMQSTSTDQLANLIGPMIFSQPDYKPILESVTSVHGLYRNYDPDTYTLDGVFVVSAVQNKKENAQFGIPVNYYYTFKYDAQKGYLYDVSAQVLEGVTFP